jgi:transposase
VLFVDRGSPHTAKGSQALARGLGIELRLLPTVCPELNPLEWLWRYLKS